MRRKRRTAGLGSTPELPEPVVELEPVVPELGVEVVEDESEEVVPPRRERIIFFI